MYATCPVHLIYVKSLFRKKNAFVNLAYNRGTEEKKKLHKLYAL